MAEESNDGQDKTEEPTEERREEFRKKGEVAYSREISSVFVLVCSVAFIALYLPGLIHNLEKMLVRNFQSASSIRMSPNNFMAYFSEIWIDMVLVILPLFILTSVAAVLSTFGQSHSLYFNTTAAQ